MAAADSSLAAAAWRGALSLELGSAGGRTAVTRWRHEGPFCIQRPFYPGDGVCHVYLLHPPGGLAGGDRLVLDVRAAGGTAVLLTTPASTKFYRSDGAPSVQTQVLHVARDASLEWLPLDTILFGGSNAEITTDVYLEAGAQFIGWEMTSIGRPLSSDAYTAGALLQRTRIYLDAEPQLLERLCWRAGDAVLDAEWGLARLGVCGALYAYPADDSLLAATREQLCAAANPDVRVAATRLDRVLVVRYLGRRPEALRDLFESLWSTLRPNALGRPPSPPRVWRT